MSVVSASTPQTTTPPQFAPGVQRATHNWQRLSKVARERVHFFPDKIARIYDQTKEGLAHCATLYIRERDGHFLVPETVAWNRKPIAVLVNGEGPMSFGHEYFTDYVTVKNGTEEGTIEVTEQELKRDESTPPLLNKWIVNTALTQQIGYQLCQCRKLHPVQNHVVDLVRPIPSAIPNK